MSCETDNGTCSCDANIKVGDYGTDFIITVLDNCEAVDISLSIFLSLKFKKPDGTTFTGTPSFNTDGSDGKIKYVVPSGLFNMAGQYSVELTIGFSNGSWSTNTYKFRVENTL